MDSSYSSSSYNPMKTSYTNPFPENDINCSSKLDEEEEDPYHPFMFNFPNSPHIHLEYEDAYLQFLDLFYQQYQSSDHDHTNIPPHEHEQDPSRNTQTIIPNTLDHHHNNNQTSTTTAKKRCSKKDRHSKINTARGLRDRRMRLSLDVARKFFDLQDLLGYDKASRTVDWLLNSAMPSIRELEISRGSVCSRVGSSTSVDDCDVASSSINQSTTVGSDQEPPPSSSSTKIKRVKKIIKVARASVSRESRIKARERARERVGQKRRLESQNTDEFRQPRSDHIEAVRVLPGADQQGGDESLVYTRPWSSAEFSHQQHQQIAEYFHACNKPWEADNIFNLSG